MQPETWLNRFLLSSQLMLELGDRGAGRQSGGWGKVRTAGTQKPQDGLIPASGLGDVALLKPGSFITEPNTHIWP